jgi:predicted acetyltransferase
MGSITVGAVKPSEYEQLYDLLWRAFDRHYQHNAWDFFRPFYEKDPFMDEEFVRVVRDGDRIVSSVTIFDRRVWIEGRPVRMGGIGNVATHPDFRGKGLSGIILDDCVSLMKKKGFDVSLLFAGPVPLYERHGWMTLKAYEYVFSGVSAPSVSPGLVCRPVSWPREHFKIFSLHKDFVKGHNFLTERNIAYWNN